MNMAGAVNESVIVLQAANPGDISIRKSTTTGREFTEFDRVMNELNDVLGHTTAYAQFVPFEITIGKNYIARVPKKSNQWCRVKVDDIMEGATTYKVICYLIDYGQLEIVDKNCMRQVDRKYFDLPAQVKSVSLANIVPAALITDTDTLNSDIGQGDSWNPSAIEHLRALVVGRLNVRVKYIPGSNHKVIMYRDSLCINDELVALKMALRQQIPVWSRPKKILSFEEFEEGERLMEVEMMKFKNGPAQQQSGDWEPLDQVLPKSSPISPPKASPINSAGKLSVKGRGQSLLESLEKPSPPASTRPETSTPPASTRPKTSTPRLPNTQSAAENISASLVDSLSDSDHSMRGSSEIPLLSTHHHSSSSQSDIGITPHHPADGSKSSSPPDSTPYKRCRRPNLNKKGRPSLTSADSHMAGSSGDTPTTAHRPLQDIQQNGQRGAGGMYYTDVPVHNSNLLSTSGLSNHVTPNSSPLSNNSSAHSSKLTRAVSFSEADEIKEFCKDAPAHQLANSSGCESDEPLHMVSSNSSKIYQKSLASTLDLSSPGITITSGISAISLDQSRVRALKKQATVFSDVPITPIFNVSNAKLHDRSLRHWRSLGGSEKKPPHILQAYAWPALRRGMELIAIADPFYMERRDGVSLSYLMAIATLLFDVESYKCLPRGGGPRCLVLCASWTKAEQIYFHASSLFGDKPEKSLLVLHGRRETEHKLYCQLINGTDVIVSTPCTFIRMLEEGHVNVERLCHLLIDDADVITKEFPSQLSAIMKEVGEAVRQHSDRSAPRQIALFSSSWSKRLLQFKKEYMTAAVTIITNKIEAAVACNVKQMIHYIDDEEQRLGTMLELVKMSGSPSIKLVVCTHTESDATKVYQALKAYSREVLVAMKSLHDLDRAIQMWEEVRSENSYPILVITDEVLDLFVADDNAVVDAKYVLHYNMPATKRLLGLRLNCLSSHYSEDADDLRLSSHIIFSPSDYLTATTLVRMIDKIGGEVPAAVRQLSISSIERNESGKRKDLCHYMKSFGVCRDQIKCPSRHLVSAQLDTPSARLPTSGDIEFKVVSVKDAVTCQARLIRHRDTNGVLHEIGSNNFSLDLSLQAYYSQPHVHIPIDPATVHKSRLCVYEKDNLYYRAEIVDTFPDPSAQFISEAKVLLLDEGRHLKVSATQLYELPKESSLTKYPLELVEIKICKLKPMDHDIQWSSEANAYMAHLLQGQTLSGKIQLCIGSTLWCDPVVKRQYLKEFGMSVSLWYANLRLTGDVNIGHLATKNPQHIDLLRKACESKISLPDISKPTKASKAAGEQLLEDSPATAAAGSLVLPTRHLEEGETSHVYLSDITDPDHLFVMLTDQHERLHIMEDELQTVMKSKGKIRLENTSLRTLCVARYPDDEKSWTRCAVMSCTGSKVQLISVDYGLMFEAELVEVSSLPSKPDDLTQLPYQAIECHMATVMPVRGSWRQEEGDLVWDSCSESESLFAKVLTIKPSRFLGDTSYGIELIKVQQPEPDLYLSDLLMSKSLALERKLDVLEQLGLTAEMEQLDYPFQLIPKLIRQLNKTEGHERRIYIVQCIRQQVQQSLNLKDEMRKQGIIKSLSSLVNSVNLHDDLLEEIVDSFTLLTLNNLENCEELWWEKGFTFLHEKLELCDDNGLLTRVLSCLKHMIKANRIKLEVDTLETFTRNLIHTARTSNRTQNKMFSLDILHTYVDGDARRATTLLKQDIATVLTDILQINHDELIESCCRVIDTLVSANQKQPLAEPWTTTLSRISTVMFKVKSDLALQFCAKALYAMLKNLTGATQLLKGTELHEKLQRLVNSGLNALTREACINVLVRIRSDPPPGQSDTRPKDGSVKSGQRVKVSQKMYLQPITGNELLNRTEIKIPAVLWWECSKFLMIQVQVHDALTIDPKLQLHYKEEVLHFRCGHYQFKLGPLYAPVVVRRSGREIYASEIKYALYKAQPGLWGNLMKSGHKKPSYVQSNMELMITSSDDEADIDYQKSPFLIKPKPVLKYSVFDSIHGDSGRPTAGLAPPVDEFLSSDEAQEEEEDERYDHEYRRQYDLFNV